MLIEVVLGLSFDYPARTITWRSDILEEHGIDNLPLGPHRITLRAGARNSASEMPGMSFDGPRDVKVVFVPDKAKH
jgi:hypothetical protein